MNLLRRNSVLAIAVLTCFTCAVLLAQDREPAMAEPLRAVDMVVGELYELVSFEANASPDWGKVKALFLDEAVVVLRSSRDKLSVFSVDGFVEDFVRFAGRAGVKEKGFTERIIRMKSTVYGDIAHIWVLYEASVTGSARPPQQGVDSFQLVRRGGRWRIVSITNEIVSEERPVPPELRE